MTDVTTDRATRLSYSNLHGQDRTTLEGMLLYLDNALIKNRITREQHESPVAAIIKLLGKIQ